MLKIVLLYFYDGKLGYATWGELGRKGRSTGVGLIVVWIVFLDRHVSLDYHIILAQRCYITNVIRLLCVVLLVSGRLLPRKVPILCLHRSTIYLHFICIMFDGAGFGGWVEEAWRERKSSRISSAFGKNNHPWDVSMLHD